MNDIQKLKGIDNGFAQSAYQALNAMSGNSEVINALKSTESTNIVESSTGSAFIRDTNDHRLDWNASLGLEGLTTGEVLSPASVLVHELNHFNLWSKDKGLSMDVYDDVKLENGDTLTEALAVEAETDSNNGVVVRYSYEGDSKPIITEGATSKTKVKDYIKSESQKKEEEKKKQQAEDIRKSIQEAKQNQ